MSDVDGPLVMKWTRETPTVTGWYWMRGPGNVGVKERDTYLVAVRTTPTPFSSDFFPEIALPSLPGDGAGGYEGWVEPDENPYCGGPVEFAGPIPLPNPEDAEK